MSLNEWKILNQIKCYVSRFNDRVINKDFGEVLQKIPSLSSGQHFRYFDYGIEQNRPSESPVKEQKKVEKTPYDLPNVLDNLKIKVKQNKIEVLPEVSKWKAPITIVSKVTILFFLCRLIAFKF